jgi:calcineurin-like phosphoesterase family protein
VGPTRLLLCHFPSLSDSTSEVRYAEHRPAPSTFDALIHGHVHNTRPAVVGREANAGVDVRGFAPVRLDVVAAELGLDPGETERVIVEALSRS